MSFRLSKSKVNTFITCPRQFKYQYIDEIKTEPNEFAKLGTNVHQIAEDFIKSGKIGTYEEILASLLELNRKYEGDYTDHCENLAKFFYEMLVTNKYTCFIAEEHLFSKKYNFNGFADIVFENKDGKLIVIDYKTGKASSAKKYKLELCYYKMLIEEKYPKYEVISTGIYFTKEGELSILEFVENPEDKNEDGICSMDDYALAINFIDTVRIEIDTGNFPRRRQYLCEYCGYKELCDQEDK